MKKSFLFVAAVFMCGVVHARITGTPPTNPDALCVGGNGAETCTDSSGNFIPTTDNDAALGTSALRWSDIQALDLTLGDDLTVTDDAAINGDTTIGSNGTDTLDINAGTVTINASTTQSLVIGTSATDGTWMMTFDANNRSIGIGENSPDAVLEVSGLAARQFVVRISSTDGSTDFISVQNNGAVVSESSVTVKTGIALTTATLRVGVVEGKDATVNHMIQYASAAVNGAQVVDFSDAGLRDCGIAPYVILTPVFNSSDDNIVSCSPHTISGTVMTIECTLSSGDGAGQATAADTTERIVNYMLACPAP